MTLEAHVDYETFSQVDLRKVGLWAYARHPSTRILCVSWAVGREEPVRWRVGWKPPEGLFAAFRRMDLFAFNAPFELAITELVASKMGWPVPKREQWNCVMAMAKMCSLPPALERVAKVLKTKHQKDPAGDKLIKLFSQPQSRTGIVIKPEDRPDDFKRFMDYNRQDVYTERDVHEALPIQRLPATEQKVWLADIAINERGVKIDRKMATGAMKLVAVAKADGGRKLSEATGGTITSAGQGKRIHALAKKLNYKLINLKKETVEAVLGDDSCPPLLRTVLELRDDTNISSVAKFAAMLRTADAEDDRVRDAHSYHQATTGRWGGRIVQTQNIPRPKLKLGPWEHDCIRRADAVALQCIHGELLPLLRDAIRNAIIAEDGYEFFVADKASIEARVLGWVAGCKGYQKAYRDGLDLYKVTAAEIYGVAYEDVTEDQRKVGKDSVLGLGYSMWFDTFYDWCMKKGAKDVTLKLCEKATKTYRKIYHEIPRSWKESEHLAIRAVRTGKPQVMGGHDGRPRIVFEMIGTYLTIKLPSGRRLWYPGAHVKMTTTKWGSIKPQLRFFTEINKKWWRVSWTYGGKIIENIVQAIARDLLARALLKCEAAGLPVVMHVHDEIVAEVLKKLKRKIDEMHAIFRSVPRWGEGLLLGSGGFVTPFYKK